MERRKGGEYILAWIFAIATIGFAFAWINSLAACAALLSYILDTMGKLPTEEELKPHLTDAWLHIIGIKSR